MSRLIALAAVTAVAVALQWGLQNTMTGKAVQAVAQDRRAARLMGIDVERTYMLTFGMGAGLAGVAGALLTPVFILSPRIGGNFILPAFAVVVLGGLGSVPGAYIGGFLIGITEALAGFYLDPSLKGDLVHHFHRHAGRAPDRAVRPRRRGGGRASCPGVSGANRVCGRSGRSWRQ